MKALWWLCFLFFSTPLHALITNESTSARILKIRSNNLLILNRGLEDGIEISDHGKITNPNGFVARAICLKATKMTSFWKVYRVTAPHKVSLDVEYTLTSINDSQVPFELEEYQDTRFSQMYVEDSEAVFIAKQKEEEAKYQAFIERRRKLQQGEDPDAEPEEDLSQLQQDFKTWNLTFGLDPFNISRTRNFSKETAFTYNLNLANQGETYQANLNFQQTNSKSEAIENTTGTPETILTRNQSDTLTGSFDKRNFIPRLSLTSNASLATEKYNGFLSSETLSVSPLGISASIVKVDPTNDSSGDHWSMSLMPSYQKFITREKEQIEDSNGDLIFSGNVLENENRVFNLTLTSQINFNIGSLAVKMNTTWGPNFSPETGSSFDTENVAITNDLSFSYPFSRSVSFTLQHIYKYNFIPQYGITVDQKSDHLITAQIRFNTSFSNQ
jgi:hypothetical protein